MQGGAERGLKAHDLAVTREGMVRLEAAFLEHLAETKQEARALALLIGEGGRGEPLPVKPDELVPFAAKKMMLFERREGDAIAAVALEAFPVSIQRRGHASSRALPARSGPDSGGRRALRGPGAREPPPLASTRRGQVLTSSCLLPASPAVAPRRRAI